MPKVLLLIPLFEIAGLVGFIHAAALLEHQEIRYLPIVLAAVPVIRLAIRNGKELASKQVVIASILLSLTFTGCFQILGYAFPGLAKDVDAFSVGNLIRLSVVAVVSIIAHTTLFMTARLFRQ